MIGFTKHRQHLIYKHVISLWILDYSIQSALFFAHPFLIVCARSGSPGSPTPKGKTLNDQQRFLVERGNDARIPLDTGMIETSPGGLTLGRSQRLVNLRAG